MSTQSRILRLIQTSVTSPRMVSGSIRGRLPASGSPLGLPLVTSNRNVKSCRLVGSQYTGVATVVMVITPLHFLLVQHDRRLYSGFVHHRCYSSSERSMLLFDDGNPAQIVLAPQVSA